jgi:drug/metabolite transporter (DMT)-like permease
VGYLFSLLGALLFGANGSMTKLLIDSGLSATQLAMFRALGTFIICGVILAIIDRSAFRLRPRQIVTMAILGVFGVALIQAFYGASISLLPVGIALLFEYTGVLFVAVIAFFFLKEKVKARLWVSIALVLVGLATVAEVWATTLNPVGIVIALLAAVTLTIYFIVGERQVGSTSPLAVAFWTTGFATLFWTMFSGWWMINPALFSKPISLTGNLSAVLVPLWMPLAICVVFGSFLSYLFSFLALKHLTATAAGIIASSEVIFAFLFAWLWLGEGLNLVQLLGAAIVLMGIVLAQTARANKAINLDLALTTGPITTMDVGGRP